MPCMSWLVLDSLQGRILARLRASAACNVQSWTGYFYSGIFFTRLIAKKRGSSYWIVSPGRGQITPGT